MPDGFSFDQALPGNGFAPITPSPVVDTSPYSNATPDVPAVPRSGLPQDVEDRAMAIYRGRRARGDDAATAIGWAANGVVESKGMPAGPRSSTGAAGTFQWLGPRLTNYKALNGREPEEGNLDEHLDFIDWENENTEQAAWKKIQNSPLTPEDRAAAIRTHWERPGRDAAEIEKEAGMARRMARMLLPSAMAMEANAQPAATPSKGGFSFDEAQAPVQPATNGFSFEEAIPKSQDGTARMARNARVTQEDIDSMPDRSADLANAPPFKIAGEGAPPAEPVPPAPQQSPEQAAMSAAGFDVAPQDATVPEPQKTWLWGLPGHENEPMTVNKPPQSTGSGYVAAAGQMVPATGAAIAGAGEMVQRGQIRAGERLLSAMDKIDQGNVGSAMRDSSEIERGQLSQYIRATPDQRAQLRQQMAQSTEEAVKAGPNMVTRAGEAIEKTGKTIFPMPDNPSFGQKVVAGASGMVPMVGSALVAGAVTGPVGAGVAGAAFVGAQTYHDVLHEAIASGEPPDRAQNAASISALTQMGLMTVPISRMLRIHPELAPKLTAVVLDLASRGGEFAGFNAMSTAANNYIAQNTFDPKRKLMEGVGEAAAIGAVTGTAMGLPNAVRQGRQAIAESGRLAPAMREYLQKGPGDEDNISAGRAERERREADSRAMEAYMSTREPQRLRLSGPEGGGPAAPTPVEPTPPVTPPRAYTPEQAAAMEEAEPAPEPAAQPKRPQVASTTPEPEGDVKAQIAALVDPNNPKDAVFLARGTELPPKPPPGVHALTRIEGTLYTTDPAKIHAFMAGDLDDEKLGKILGYPETKADAVASGQPVVVEAKDAEGNVVAGAVASPERVQETQAAIAEQMPPGGAVEVRPPVEAQAEREARAEGSPLPVNPKMPSPQPSMSGAYTMLSPSQIVANPGAFQYKEAGPGGVTGALQGVSRWEPALANPITVWQDNNGQFTVVNGHQRYDLAQRAEAAGQQVQMPAAVFREADGYTPAYMRLLGAYQNMAEGSGTAIDAAKVLRGQDEVPPDLRLPDLPPRGQIVSQANSLAKLSDPAFGMVENGLVQPSYAALVGAAIADPAEQLAALDMLRRAAPPNIEQAGMMVRDIKNSGYLKGSQTTLFGDESFARSLVLERAQVLDAALRTLRRVRGIFGTAVEHEETLTAAGNQLFTAANTKAKSDNERLYQILSTDAAYKGELSDALNRLATEVADGKPIAGAATRFLAEARRAAGLDKTAPVQPGHPAHGKEPEAAKPVGPSNSDLFGKVEKPPAPKKEPEATVKTDPNQAVMPGMAPSAVQAQAAADAKGRGGIQPPVDQEKANEGLFAPPPVNQPSLPTPETAALQGIPKTIYQGTGRGDKASAYNGVAVPIAGAGRYFSFSEADARKFGPDVKQSAIDLKNPLVIRSDQEWRALTKEAGWRFPNPHGLPQAEVEAATERLKQLILSRGHDGLVAYWDNATEHDIDKSGNSIKTLRNALGVPQVVDYRPPVEQPAMPPVALMSEAHEVWWDKDLTLEGRKRVMDAAGLKRVPRIKWKYLNEAERTKLLANRGAAEEKPTEAKPPASGVVPRLPDELARKESVLFANGWKAREAGQPRVPDDEAKQVGGDRKWERGWDAADKAAVKPVPTPEEAFRTRLENTGFAQSNGGWKIVPHPFMKDAYVVEHTAPAMAGGYRTAHGSPDSTRGWSLDEARQAAVRMAFPPEKATKPPALTPEASPPAPTEQQRPNWLNEGDIDQAIHEFAADPLLGPVTRWLGAFKDAVDKNSDGWAYWKAPTNAAKPLMGLISGAMHPRSPVMPTAGQIDKAMRPIKAFATRHKFTLPDTGELPVKAPTVGNVKPEYTAPKKPVTPQVTPPWQTNAGGPKPEAEQPKGRYEYNDRLKIPAEIEANRLTVDALNGLVDQKVAIAGLGKLVRDGAIPEAVGRINLERLSDWSEGEWERAKEQPKAEARPEPEQPQEKPGYGADNKTFTADAAAKARARLREKLNRFSAGFDPEMMLDGMTLAGFHIEAGARRFGEYAKAMIADLGEGIRPYLAHFYNSVRDYPGFDNHGMDGASVVRDIDLNDPRLSPILEPEAEHGVQGPVPGRDDLAGSEDVHGPAAVGETGGSPEAGVPPGAPDVGQPVGEGAEGTGRLAEEPERGSDSGGTSPGDTNRLPRPPSEREPGATGRPPAPDSWVVGTNFRIEPGALDETRGPTTKARDNLAAIELAKKLTADSRPASKAEQAILAKYVGWGGLSGVFPNPATGAFGKGLEKVGTRLKEALTPAEYEAAAGSTQNAHYTAEHIIRSMWDAVDRMGFKGGSVFEPGMGVGHFLGLMPADMAERSAYQGIELDNSTADIAKLLYPQSGIRQADFIATPMPENHFDLAIGNPPFSDVVIKADPKYTARGFMLHDYFFAKSLDSVRPGGLMAYVTSAGTMNKIDPAARQYLAQRAEFVGGVRLPSNAFRQNAGTDVTTDILFFKKRPGTLPLDQVPDHEAWTETVQRSLPDFDGNQKAGNVNRYFSDHPEMVLGKEGYFDKLYKGRYAVHADPDRDLPTAIREAFQRLPADIMEAPQTPEQKAALDFASGQKKEGSFYLGPKGVVMQYRGGAGQEAPKRGKAGGFTVEEMDRIKHLVPIRDALRDVFRHDLSDNAEDAAKARVALNKHYDTFVKKFGPINKAEFQFRRPTLVQMEAARLEAREEARDIGQPWDDGDFNPGPLIAAGKTNTEIAKARQAERAFIEGTGAKFDEGTFDPEDMPDIKIEQRPNIKPFMSDPESYRLRSIERYNDDTGQATKKRIFHESVLTREEEPQINSANDGLLWSLNKFGRMDLDEIADKMDKSKDLVITELGDAIFRLPDTGDTYQSAAEYLSGDVVAKLAEARTAMTADRDMERNVRALEGALPVPLPPSDISMNLGMPWMPKTIMEQFASNHLRIGRVEITHIPSLGTWKVDEVGRQGDRSGILTYGTTRRQAEELLSDAMNRTPPRIYDTDRDGKRTFNATATQEAQEKMDLIKSEFSDWIERDPERLQYLAQTYNDALNRTVLRVYDGSYLTTPGISSEWRWRPHQTRVVARIVQSGSTYMAHAVGAGKTSAMIGAGMEMRRLGLVKKPMYAVPNHMLGQFTKEFYEQYPTAKIMVADEDRFHTDRRRQFLSDVSQDDLDAVIITHSSFGKIPISDEFQATLVQEELDRIAEAMEDLDPHTDRVTIKALKNQQDKMKQKLAKAAAGSKDLTNTFEEMGVDFLFVDEAHNFRKLSLATKQGGLKGITAQGSNMAWDLFTKIRYLDEKSPGRAAVLASGTPVTNTMGELYTVSRFLQRPALETRGIEHFDSWSQMFGDTKTELEAQPDGNFKPVTRFARFVNMPELYKMVGEVMDVVTPAQLEQYVTRPKLAGGERKLHIAPFTDKLADYQAVLAERMRAIAERKGPPEKGDDIILSVINDGRHVAIDPRFVMHAKSDPESKLNMMIDNVHRIWKETKDHQFYHARDNYTEKAHRGPATQMIFMNMGVNGRGPMGFSGYSWIRSQLRAKGIPANEIAIIGDYKGTVARQALFNDMNEGKVRVLLGSVAKMGTGVNAQRLMIALHNQDPLWFPADDEQRVGRMLRQGNMNPEVQVHDYTTMDTYDRVMWQMMGRKGRFIEQFFRGDPELRDMEDLGEAGMFEQAAAMTTSDPRVFKLTELRQQLQTAERRASAFERRQYDLQQQKKTQESWATYYRTAIAGYERDIEQRRDTRGDAFKMTVGDKSYAKRKDAAEALTKDMSEVVNGLGVDKSTTIGDIGGFPVVAAKGKKLTSSVEFFLQLNNNRELSIDGSIHHPDWSAGFIKSAEAKLRNIEDYRNYEQSKLAEAEENIPRLDAALQEPFKGGGDIQRLRAELRQLETDMAPKKEEGEAPKLAEGWGAVETANDAQTPSTQAVQAAADAVRHILGGNVHVAVVDGGIRYSGDGKPSRFIGGYAIGRLIRVALDAHTLENLNHEAIHALRNLGAFTLGEWNALEEAARRGNWIKKHDIERRYAGASDDTKTEEAIAEEFARGNWDKVAPTTLLGRLTAKLRQWFQRLRLLLGREGIGSHEDVFGAVRRGEVGARAPGSGMRERGPDTLEGSLRGAKIFDPSLRLAAPRVGGGPRLNVQGSRGETIREKRNIARAAAEIKAVLAPTSLHNAKPMEQIARRHGSELAQSGARAMKSLETSRAAIEKLSKADQIEFTDRMEKGLPQPTPELTSVATALRDVLDQWTAKVQSLGRGLLSTPIDNYMGHIYGNYHEWLNNQPNPTAAEMEDRSRMATLSKRPIQGSKNFLKRRSFPTQKEAIDAGLIPLTHNPIDLQLMKVREMQKFYHGTRLADLMKDSGVAVWVPAGKEGDAGAEGLAKLDDRVFQPRLVGDANKAGFGRLEPGNWYAPESMARIFNNYVSQGLSGHSAIYDAIRLSGNMLNSLQLALSGFHATFVTLDTALSRTALGLHQLMRPGQRAEGLGNVALGGIPGLNLLSVVKTIKNGNKLRNAWLDPQGATPEWRALADDLNRGGGRINMDQFYRNSAAGSFFKNLSDLKNPLSPFHQAAQMFRDAPSWGQTVMVPFRLAARLIDTMMEPLMGQMVPRAKLGAFSEMAKSWNDAHPAATDEERSAEMIKAWDSVENRLGQMTYDDLYWHRLLKDLAFIMVRSVGWNLGTWREIGGGMVDTAHVPIDLAKGNRPQFTYRMAYLMLLPIITAINGALLQFLMTGEGPKELLDLYYPRIGGEDSNAVPRRLNIPGYMKDIIGFWHAPRETLLNKTHPLISAANQVMTNKDYYGGIIYAPSVDNPFAAYGDFLVGQHMPFAWRAMNKLSQDGYGPTEQALAFWGFQPAPAWVMNPERAEKFERRTEMRGIRTRAREKGRLTIFGTGAPEGD